MATCNLIAQASMNENGKTLEGYAGDQTGFELNACAWFSNPWTHVYRATNPEHREKIAAFMELAVTNGFIGYDTNRVKRDTLYNSLKENGFDVATLDEPCFADCSSLVFCAVYSVTGNEFSHDDEDVNNTPRVRHYEDYIENVCGGFEKLTGAMYTDSPDNLERGDILVALGEHVAVYI